MINISLNATGSFTFCSGCFHFFLSKQASQYAIEASALQSGSPLFSNTEHGKLNGSLRITLLYFVSLIQDEGPLWLWRGIIWGNQVTLVLAYKEPIHSSPGGSQRGIIQGYQVIPVPAHQELGDSSPRGLQKGNNLRIPSHTSPGALSIQPKFSRFPVQNGMEWENSGISFKILRNMFWVCPLGRNLWNYRNVCEWHLSHVNDIVPSTRFLILWTPFILIWTIESTHVEFL